MVRRAFEEEGKNLGGIKLQNKERSAASAFGSHSREIPLASKISIYLYKLYNKIQKLRYIYVEINSKSKLVRSANRNGLNSYLRNSSAI